MILKRWSRLLLSQSEDKLVYRHWCTTDLQNYWFFVANLRQVYIIQEEKRKILFFFPFAEKRFHLFGLTILLTDFHSVVKIEKNLSKCWYHFQTVLSASQFTGNSWCSQTNPVFTHRPRVLKKKKTLHSFGGFFFKCHSGGISERAV